MKMMDMDSLSLALDFYILPYQYTTHHTIPSHHIISYQNCHSLLINYLLLKISFDIPLFTSIAVNNTHLEHNLLNRLLTYNLQILLKSPTQYKQFTRLGRAGPRNGSMNRLNNKQRYILITTVTA